MSFDLFLAMTQCILQFSSNIKGRLMIFIFIKGIMVSLQPTEEEKIKYEFIFSPDPMGLRKYIYIIFHVCVEVRVFVCM